MIRIKDNALDNPAEDRERAISCGFTDQTGPDGAVYHGIGTIYQPDLKPVILQVFPEFTQIDIKVQAWRMDLEGSPCHNIAHADKMCADYAAILYMTPPEHAQGGTAFYQHRETGALKHDFDNPENYESVEADWTKLDAWNIHAFVGMVFNRIVVFDSRMYHGRQPTLGYGQSPENARLINICFFDMS